MLKWQKRTGKVRIFNIPIWISIHVPGLIKTFDSLSHKLPHLLGT